MQTNKQTNPRMKSWHPNRIVLCQWINTAQGPNSTPGWGLCICCTTMKAFAQAGATVFASSPKVKGCRKWLVRGSDNGNYAKSGAVLMPALHSTKVEKWEAGGSQPRNYLKNKNIYQNIRLEICKNFGGVESIPWKNDRLPGWHQVAQMIDWNPNEILL